MHGRGRGRGRGGGGGPPMFHGGMPPGDDPRSVDKTMRSIFVANISFDTTEEQLGSILSEVGPIVNLKIIYDPGTGKPRGFGFCEYEDPETAMSAMRNLAGRELNGRPLRIDSASNAPLAGGPPGGMNMEGSRGPGGSGPGQRPVEPPMYGASVPPENAPEVITKAVASLPPEQMFELMKQMKWFIQQNPQEARQLLLHNPQLAYALLQAQVVMKIVDLDTAQSLLYRSSRGPSLVQPSGGSHTEHQGPPPAPPPAAPPIHHGPPGGGGGGGGGDPGYNMSRDPYHEPARSRENQPRPLQGDYNRMRQGGPPLGYDRGGPPPRGSPRGGDMRPSPTLPTRDGLPAQDKEKAALIMQVLSLTDEQIQMLPPDQRSSILKLKDQIARSH